MMDVKSSFRTYFCFLLFILTTGLKKYQFQKWMLGETQTCPVPCKCYNLQRTWSCGNLRLHNIPVLANTTKRLYVQNNLITNLEAEPLVNSQRLVVLSLRGNRISEVFPSVFKHMLKLEELILSANRIYKFHASYMTSLPALRELDLSKNYLAQTPLNLSHFAPNLQTLNLSENDIQQATFDWTYSEMTSLGVLNLCGNKIQNITKADLAPLSLVPPISKLDLSSNAITHIQRDAFQGFYNLTQLSLADNSILQGDLQIVFDNFSPYNNVHYLDLSHLLVKNVSSDLLSNFPNIISLDLSASAIEVVHNSFYMHLPRLEVLKITHNHVHDVSVMVNKLDLMRNLNFSTNEISQLVPLRLRKLEEIDFSYNQISQIPKRWISGSRRIEIRVVRLCHNKMRQIHSQAFRGAALQTLDLSHNRLTSLHSMGASRIINLRVGHNRISNLTRGVFKGLEVSLEVLDLSANYLHHLLDDFFHEFIQLQSLSLARNNLGVSFRFGQHMSLFSGLGHLQVLDLSHCNITRLPHAQFQHLHHLTTLTLTGNRVRDIGELNLRDMTSLAKMDLSHNALREVDMRHLLSARRLNTLDLSFNQFKCNCKLLPFIAWFNTTRVTVLGRDLWQNYACASPASLLGQPVIAYNPPPQKCNPPGFWSRHFVLLASTVGVSIALVFIIVIVVHYGKLCQRIKLLQYRWQVRYREVSGIEICEPTDSRLAEEDLHHEHDVIDPDKLGSLQFNT